MLAVIQPAGYGSLSADPATDVAYLDHLGIMYVWNLVAYVVFGIALVITVLAVHQHLAPRAPWLSRRAGAFGLIWAGLMFSSGMVANSSDTAIAEVIAWDTFHARAVWMSRQAVVDGLGSLALTYWCLVVWLPSPAIYPYG